MKRLTVLLVCARLPLGAEIHNVPAEFATAQLAANACAPGDTILFAAGTYGTLDTAINGTAGAGRIIIDGQNVATLGYIEISHSNYTVQNLACTGAGTITAACIYISRDADNGIISHVNIDTQTTVGRKGIRMESPTGTLPYGLGGPENWLIEYTNIDNVIGTEALTIMGADNIVDHCKIRNGLEMDGFHLFGERHKVQYCLFDGNRETPLTTNHPDWCQTFGTQGHGSEDHEIHHNIVVDYEVAAVAQLEGNLVEEVRNWTFHHNALYNVLNPQSNSVPGIVWEHNTFYRVVTGSGHVLPVGERFSDHNSIAFTEEEDALISTPIVSGGILEDACYIVRPNGTSGQSVTYDGQVYNADSSEVFFGTSETTFTKTHANVQVLRQLANIPHNCVNRNNVFVECGNGTASQGWYGFTRVNDNSDPARFSDTVLTGFVADYNFGSRAAGAAFDAGTAQYPDPAYDGSKWFELNGINGGSINFANTADIVGPDGEVFTADDGLRLLAGSAAIGSGLAGVDMGAYEFTAGGQSGVVNATNLNVSGTTTVAAP